MKPARLVLFAIASSTIGLLVSDWAFEPPVVSARTNSEDVWAMPSLPDSQSTLASHLRLAKRYQATLPERTGAARVLPSGGGNDAWALRGIVRKDGASYVLIQQGEDVQRFAQGAVLPDGSRLTAIAESAISVEVEGRELEVQMYSSETK